MTFRSDGQTDLLRALGESLGPSVVPDYQDARHGPQDKLFEPVRTIPGQLALDTEEKRHAQAD